jgi:hypothetical protein
MKSIAIVIKFFGKPVPFLKLWMKGASSNKTIDFILLIDSKNNYLDWDIPNNVHLIEISEKEFKERADCATSLNCNMGDFGYHCNQFRPLFGLMFPDILKNYDFWGFADTDILLGDIRDFVSENVLLNNDKIYSHGHFTLMRNTNENNKRILLSDKDCLFGYSLIYTHAVNNGFDEMYGLTKVWEKEHFSYFDSKDDLCNINPYHNSFTCNSDSFSNGSPVCFFWNNGKLYEYYLDKTGQLNKKEILYAHFQSRTISNTNEVLKDDSFFVVPNKCEKDVSVVDFLKKSKNNKSIFSSFFMFVKLHFVQIKRYCSLFLLLFLKLFKKSKTKTNN